MSDSAVLFEEIPAGQGSKIGFITLNAEKSLNALSLEMIESISPRIDAWEQTPSIKAIFLQGAGAKAFCAGGDIRKLFEAMKEGEGQKRIPYAERFFVEEYTLDHKIHTSRKPVIVWGHGIVMGGGLGLMAGGDARIVTETSMIAMPEITIGLYPDVGASHFLNRMPEGMGLFLGLTGARMNAADALYVGLADFYMPSEQKERFIELLTRLPWAESGYENKLLLKEELKGFTSAFTVPAASSLKLREARIAALAQATSAQEYSKRLAAVVHEDPWFEKSQRALASGSPTSARVIFEQLKRAKGLSLNEVFAREGAMTVQFALHHDFKEGVRALIIDKDNKPHWQPTTLDDVSDALVEEHFRSPWPEGQNPLSQLRAPQD